MTDKAQMKPPMISEFSVKHPTIYRSAADHLIFMTLWDDEKLDLSRSLPSSLYQPYPDYVTDRLFVGKLVFLSSELLPIDRFYANKFVGIVKDDYGFVLRSYKVELHLPVRLNTLQDRSTNNQQTQPLFTLMEWVFMYK